jgi:RNA-directed DNA polymerase
VNVDEMQKKLSLKATKEPEHQFENLYGLLCNETWLRVAATKVLKNTGSKTAGIDSMTDIEQPLTGRNLIKPIDLFPK